MEKIRVDFNRRGTNGELISSIRRASGLIALGDVVEVFQPGEDDMTTTATVVAIAADGKLRLLPLVATVFASEPSTGSFWSLFRVSTAVSQPSADYFKTPVAASV